MSFSILPLSKLCMPPLTFPDQHSSVYLGVKPVWPLTLLTIFFCISYFTLERYSGIFTRLSHQFSLDFTYYILVYPSVHYFGVQYSVQGCQTSFANISSPYCSLNRPATGDMMDEVCTALHCRVNSLHYCTLHSLHYCTVHSVHCCPSTLMTPIQFTQLTTVQFTLLSKHTDGPCTVYTADHCTVYTAFQAH